MRRAPAENDRRVKLIVLTDEGERVREEITKRLAEPPPAIAALKLADQEALRDILRRAVDSVDDTPPTSPMNRGGFQRRLAVAGFGFAPVSPEPPRLGGFRRSARPRPRPGSRPGRASTRAR